MNKKPTGGKHPRTWVSHVSLFHQPRKPPKIQILRVYIDRFHRHSYKNPTTWGLDSSRRRRISPGNHDPTHFTRKTTCRGWAPIPAVRWLPPRTRLSSSLEFAESTAILVGSKSENHLQNKCSMIIIYSIYTRILWRKKKPTHTPAWHGLDYTPCIPTVKPFSLHLQGSGILRKGQLFPEGCLGSFNLAQVRFPTHTQHDLINLSKQFTNLIFTSWKWNIIHSLLQLPSLERERNQL